MARRKRKEPTPDEPKEQLAPEVKEKDPKQRVVSLPFLGITLTVVRN
jgi:hypothetical protein